jgi:hypothetical protein
LFFLTFTEFGSEKSPRAPKESSHFLEGTRSGELVVLVWLCSSINLFSHGLAAIHLSSQLQLPLFLSQCWCLSRRPDWLDRPLLFFGCCRTETFLAHPDE